MEKIKNAAKTNKAAITTLSNTGINLSMESFDL
jgi:hypothetical protein